MTTTRGGEVTRRGFLAAVGVGAAATAIPASTLAAALPARAGGAPTGEVLAWYRHGLEEVAENLRPRFESGELHAMTDEECDDEGRDTPAPMWSIGHAAGERFRLVRTEDGEPYEGSERAAHLVLAASPSTPRVDDGSWNHAAFAAREAAMWDVIFLARERGWYTPGPTEQLGRDNEEDQELRGRGSRSTAALVQSDEPHSTDRATLARGGLEEARARAEQVVQDLLRSLQQDQPLQLDDQVTRARHELDLLWQAVGRVTEPA